MAVAVAALTRRRRVRAAQEALPAAGCLPSCDPYPSLSSPFLCSRRLAHTQRGVSEPCLKAHAAEEARERIPSSPEEQRARSPQGPHCYPRLLQHLSAPPLLTTCALQSPSTPARLAVARRQDRRSPAAAPPPHLLLPALPPPVLQHPYPTPLARLWHQPRQPHAAPQLHAVPPCALPLRRARPGALTRAGGIGFCTGPVSGTDRFEHAT